MCTSAHLAQKVAPNDVLVIHAKDQHAPPDLVLVYHTVGWMRGCARMGACVAVSVRGWVDTRGGVCTHNSKAAFQTGLRERATTDVRTRCVLLVPTSVTSTYGSLKPVCTHTHRRLSPPRGAQGCSSLPPQDGRYPRTVAVLGDQRARTQHYPPPRADGESTATH
jgi:hypothetical protein